MKKLTTNQKYLANCSKALCRAIRRTAHVLSGAAADYHDVHAEREGVALNGLVKNVNGRLTGMEKAREAAFASMAKKFRELKFVDPKTAKPVSKPAVKSAVKPKSQASAKPTKVAAK